MKKNLLFILVAALMLSSCGTQSQTADKKCSKDSNKECAHECGGCSHDSNKECGAGGCCADSAVVISTPDQAIAELQAGNERYAASKMKSTKRLKNERIETLDSQKPFAAVVACSDSRIPVELLFDQGIGDLFVIRTAGNSVHSYSVMGSIEYAIDHLEVPLVVILGHQNCGGVTGAIAEGHGKEHEELDELLHSIQTDVKEYIGHPEQLDEAIHHNTKAQVESINSIDYIAEKVKAGELKVVGGYYSIETGKVIF